MITGVLYCWKYKIPIWKMLDIAGPGIMLGLAFGRIGCFLAGCCHGLHCEVPVTSTLVALLGGEVES